MGGARFECARVHCHAQYCGILIRQSSCSSTCIQMRLMITTRKANQTVAHHHASCKPLVQ